MIPIQYDYNLRQLNTFGMNVNAKYYVEISEMPSLRDFIKSGEIRQYAEYGLLPIGGGSNLLFTKDYPGLVIHVLNKGIEIIEKKNTSVWVRVAAGENWHEFVTWCVERGFGGIENLSLIPGNVGSCPIQNIGAYGVEVKDTIYEVEAMNLQTGEIELFTNKDCQFGYRSSIFKQHLKGQYVIVAVNFCLSLAAELHVGYGTVSKELENMGVVNPSISDISKAVCNIRSSKLPNPDTLGNAGSFFKNPTVNHEKALKLKDQFPEIVQYALENGNVKLAAAWMIEQCGWKGLRRGDAGVHVSQALVLVNYGNASGEEIVTLANEIMDSVYQRFGVVLEKEVNII